MPGFENYLQQYPEASQTDSARYWIGECYYSQKDYKKAIEEFTMVLKDHPKSEKAPGARLKIGYSYLAENNTTKAKEHLNRVLKDYPHSREADLAREKLKKSVKQKGVIRKKMAPFWFSTRPAVRHSHAFGANVISRLLQWR